MESSTHVSVGISQLFPCSYLEEQQEQLLIIQEPFLDPLLFERLLQLGFRRSGEAIYKPRCPACSACIALRVPARTFQASKRQKRTLAKNKDLTVHWVSQSSDEHYTLYEKYINLRHFDGPMFPASREQYEHFVLCDWAPPGFVELRLEGRLLAVAVTDVLPTSLSAIYSFFDPDFDARSLGSQLILTQMTLAAEMDKAFVYLGYQIDANRKMCYKRLYRPYQILTQKGWEFHTNTNP
ncbi:arginyltransferase [Shewanella litorisediminis]|uniref:Aspartate/glutamate leucyltransferase n=1 Tax=Shewanella litorisediminis TaxID=1173586 RepID=A0ABX7FZ78_9GAMM|nr:arginyltransferase [Shewanella litorisediminis]MCL2918688.1 arginyltransferase [Shewanella litorisediminis]QRH00338.1 arginyltransferase [Shewanella litorisediminis]